VTAGKSQIKRFSRTEHKQSSNKEQKQEQAVVAASLMKNNASMDLAVAG
jgi:hypothetical protein